MRGRHLFATTTLALLLATPASAQDVDFNSHILRSVDWIATNRAALGYDLRSRFTENLRYGDYTFQAKGNGKTMCVAAVFEVIVRSVNQYQSETPGASATQLLPGKMLSGSKALNLMPYIFQYKSKAQFPEYARQYSAGAGDAFVLFGIGRYASFAEAKPGDFVYFNRNNGSGHAAVFMAYLDASGAPTPSHTTAVGYRYFSAQKGGTDGFGYRDAFFDGHCPRTPTTYLKDCGVRRSDVRREFSISRLHHPSQWYPKYSAIRIQQFFNGTPIDTIYAQETAFRKEGVDQEEKAREAAKKLSAQGVFPMIRTKIAGRATTAELELKRVEFNDEFGPAFEQD